MNDEFPLVSIIAACYNHALFVVEALESIKNQSYPNIQLIITNDASTDKSKDIIESWIKQQEFAIQFISNETNKGVCYTFNKALKQVKGQYFQVISCDDVMLLNKIQQQVDFLESASEEFAMVCTDAQVIDQNSNLTHTSFLDFWNLPTDLPENAYKQLLLQNTILAPSVLIRTAVLDEVGYYDESLCFEDWDMWLRISKNYKIKMWTYPLVNYRHFATSFSQSNSYRPAILKDSIKLLDKQRGYSKEIDSLVAQAQRPRIIELIENNDASIGHLWKKLKYDKTVYSLFLFLCSLVGINQQKAHAIKTMIKQ